MAPHWIEITVLVVVALLIVPYILGPFVVFRGQRFAIPVEIIDVDVDVEFPENIRAYFERARDLLAKEGFDCAGTVYLPTAVADVRSILALYANRTTNDMAMVTVIIAMSDDQRISTMYVEFDTSFSDGVKVETNNSPQISAFARGTKRYTTQLPEIDDPVRLLRIHRFLVERHRESGRPQCNLDSDYGGAVAEFVAAEAIERPLAEQVDVGYFVRTPQEYRPTIKGAIIMTWQELWPLKTLRRWSRRRHAARVLREYEATLAG